MNYAIVTAAGKGTRFGGNKALYPLQNKPLLAWSLSIFENSLSIDEIYVAIPSGAEEAPYRRICSDEGFTKVKFVQGGETRYDSVRNAFLSLKPSEGVVMIHDAARPLLSPELFQRVFDATIAYGAAIPVLPVSETVKEVESEWVVRTMPRENLFTAQTPQGFQSDVLKAAYSKINDNRVTDEAMLVEMAGFRVHVVKGERKNIKITEASDIKLAECFL